MPKKSKTLTDEEYKAKREKNNAAVKRSREKTQKKMAENKARVDLLNKNIPVLESKIEAEKKEIQTTRDLCIELAKNKYEKLTPDERNLLEQREVDVSNGKVLIPPFVRFEEFQ